LLLDAVRLSGQAAGLKPVLNIVTIGCAQIMGAAPYFA
jgi:hypothetical protein